MLLTNNDIDNGQQTEPAIGGISSAGQAFLDSLISEGTVDGKTPEPGDTAEDGDPNLVDVPLDSDTPEGDSGITLESIRDSILNEIQALKQGESEQDKPEDSAEEQTETEKLNPLGMSEDEFMEKFSANPLQAVMELSNTIADQRIQTEMATLVEKMKPMLDQAEEAAFEQAVKETVAEFLNDENYSDAEQYLPQIAEAIKSGNLPMNDIKSYQNVYKDIALADARANKGKSLEEYLSDENEISKIISNPKIQEQVIREYLQNISHGGKPQVISNGGSSSPSATPPTDIRTFADAGAAFRRQL